ncbi:MAG: Hpt domain-containing protein, partial [Xanthomonadales bacterium]|nr:Hpt domain-containing protein [Xanthomonadales bacterium]
MNSNYEIDFTTLNWVKQELEDTLKQARQSLESYVEDPQDASLMRFCASYLHQVQGTLRMVELYGAAMVVEEMERLAQALLDGKVRQTEEAYQILMRGMLQVPDYLDRLQSGHRDIPIVLLPLLNDLRACRGEKLLTETALFSPDLSRSLPANVSGPEHALPEPVLKANAARLRMAFQLGLLKWFKGEDVSANTARLALILDRLQAATAQVDGRRLWWVGGGLLDAVRADKVESSVSVKLLVGRVDREIKNLVDQGEAWFVRQPPLELTKNL